MTASSAVDRRPSLTVIVPSRNRPQAVKPMWESFVETCTNPYTELVFVVNDTDPTLPEYRKIVDELEAAGAGSLYVYDTTSDTMVGALNDRAVDEATMCAMLPFHLGFMGDDHRPRTSGWDQEYIDAIEEGALVVYGNDLLQGRAMPTQVAMNWRVVDALGYMAPPQFFHLCIDLVWKDWGDKTGRIKYLPDTIVEHLHPAADKAVYDDDYHRVNNPEVVRADADRYHEYVKYGLEQDVKRLQEIPQ